MSARTFAEWQAYCSLEPFGPPAEFWRAGLITSMIANVNRTSKRQPFKPEDFMPMELYRTEPDPEEEAIMLRQQVERLMTVRKGSAR